MELLDELRAIRRDVNDLGDSVAVALLGRAERCFLACEMDEGERYLEQALSRVLESLEQPEPAATSGVSRYFQTCAMAIA